MTYYDGAMAAVVIAGMIWGAWKGITWQVASIASLVLGYSVAHPLSSEPVVARALAMIVVYLAVSGGVFFAAWLVRATLRKLQFEAFDRHLGMILGGFEGALLGLVATLFVVSLAPQTRTPIFSSPTGKVVGQVMATLGPVLPSEARTVLAPFWGTGDALAADGAKPAPSTPLIPRLAGRAQPNDSKSDNQDQDNPGASPLKSLIEKEEARLGKAIVETAEKEIGQTATDGNDGRAVERR
jgi:membrane protein required for colicin V production